MHQVLHHCICLPENNIYMHQVQQHESGVTGLQKPGQLLFNLKSDESGQLLFVKGVEPSTHRASAAELVAFGRLLR